VRQFISIGIKGDEIPVSAEADQTVRLDDRRLSPPEDSCIEAQPLVSAAGLGNGHQRVR